MSTTPAKSRSLGSDTKSIHAAAAIRNRYALRREAQGILYVHGQNANEQHRTCYCGRAVRDGQDGVVVHRQVGGGKARYQGLAVCGDVWACPSCAAKIAGQRRRELERAMVAANLAGLHGYLLTLTFPHEAGLELGQVLGQFAKALQSFHNGRKFKGFMARHQVAGRIKGLEVTHGGNGWHPHVHVLVFGAPGLLDDVRGLDELRDAWVAALLKQGLGSREKLSDMLAHALDFRGGDDAAGYIAKYGHDERWGMSSEMTAGMKKIGAIGDHYTPFQLLEISRHGEGWARGLYREYVLAFRGKRALTWTPGLRRQLLGAVDEATDEALANLDDPEPEEEYVGAIKVDDYQEILARGLEGELLWIVATWAGEMTQDNLDELVAGWIANYPRSRSGAIARHRRGLGRSEEQTRGFYGE